MGGDDCTVGGWADGEFDNSGFEVFEEGRAWRIFNYVLDLYGYIPRHWFCIILSGIHLDNYLNQKQVEFGRPQEETGQV